MVFYVVCILSPSTPSLLPLVLLSQLLHLHWMCSHSSSPLTRWKRSQTRATGMPDRLLEMFSKWNRMTVDELKAFLGFHILMAMNHLYHLWMTTGDEILCCITPQLLTELHMIAIMNCCDIFTLLIMIVWYLVDLQVTIGCRKSDLRLITCQISLQKSTNHTAKLQSMRQ